LAEETRKAKEATRVQQPEESQKSEVAAEEARVAKDKTEKEETERIRAAQEALKEGILRATRPLGDSWLTGQPYTNPKIYTSHTYNL
jgi:hypothetical protein